MIYIPETLAEFQPLLTAFHEYIQTSPYFEILFSPRQGFLFLRIEGEILEIQRIATSDDLFQWLIDATRKRVLPHIECLPDTLREHYTALAEEYFRLCNERGGNGGL